MAVTYLSGERIQGSSAALATPTYSGDLGTWAATGSQVTESSDVVSFAITTRIANHTISNDLGSALSDSEWVMRCKIIFTTLTPGGNSTCFLEIGMGDTNHSAAPDNDGNPLDYMGLQLRLAATNGTSYKAWGLVGYNSSGVVDNPETPVLDTAPTTQTYYMEMKRLSTTSMSIGLYDSDSFDSLIMPVETKTGISSGVSGLRYLRVGNALVDSESSTGNVITGTVRDFQIWNATTAVTSDEKATITNVPAGTRYEETDTLKIFHRRTQTGGAGGDSWVEKGTALAASALRGVFCGGYIHGGSDTDIMDYISISTTGNAIDFGNLTVARPDPAGCADSSRGVVAGGSNSYINVIEYITIATLGNATDFGDLTVGRNMFGGCASSTRGVFGGGQSGSYSNVIDYITIQSTGNATDFGNLTVAREGVGSCADATRGVWAAGNTGSFSNVIDYITIASTGNATDFGNLTVTVKNSGGLASSTRGCFAGGYGGSYTNVIDYITIQTTGNATDFGDLLLARRKIGTVSDLTRGVWGSGESASNTNAYEYITIATTGNCIDFGDGTAVKYGMAGVAA